MAPKISPGFQLFSGAVRILEMEGPFSIYEQPKYKPNPNPNPNPNTNPKTDLG